jgi:hypothetical protein
MDTAFMSSLIPYWALPLWDVLPTPDGSLSKFQQMISQELQNEKACPFLNELQQWLKAEQSKLLLKSAIGKAVHYLLLAFSSITCT